MPRSSKPRRLAEIMVIVITMTVASMGPYGDPAAYAARPSSRIVEADLVVYGGTPGGVMAAVAAARMGRSVIIVERMPFVGGMISGGLIRTDIGDPETIGGLAREFFDRNEQYYIDRYGENSPQVGRAYDGFFTEPSVAEHLFNEMISAEDIRVFRKRRLVSAALDGKRIRSITVAETTTGARITCRGDMFVDASYAGDLMAAAGVPYRVGRESRAEYGESFAGVNEGPAETIGAGDHKLQAYNIRQTVTDDPSNRVLIPRPDRYNPEPFAELKEKIIREGITELEEAKTDLSGARMPNRKYDPNDADLPEVNHAYPEASWRERRQIYERVRDHWLSLWYMLQNDPDLPRAFRKDAREWGLPRDEFAESNHITPQLYIREARRMIGRYVLTQNDILSDRFKDDAIALGSYNMDSHVVDSILTEEGLVAEGGFIELCDAYEVPYGVIVPPENENVLVVGAASATHVAYGSLRMEPVFMMLGHTAGLAAHLAMATGKPVQQVDVRRLQSLLRSQGAVLKAPYRPDVRIAFSPDHPEAGEEVAFEVVKEDVRHPITRVWWNFDGSGRVQAKREEVSRTFSRSKVHQVTVLVEDESGLRSRFTRAEVLVGDNAVRDVVVEAEDGEMIGEWHRARAPRYDFRLLYEDGNEKKGQRHVRFIPNLPREGRYLVAIAYPAGLDQADRVPVRVKHKGGVADTTIDQTQANTPMVFKPLKGYYFEKGEKGWVEISNDSSDGEVAVDAVKWIWLGKSEPSR